MNERAERFTEPSAALLRSGAQTIVLDGPPSSSGAALASGSLVIFGLIPALQLIGSRSGSALALRFGGGTATGAVPNSRRPEPAVRIPDRLVSSLRNARRIAALTGAGISKESGLPTFREAQTGLWARFRPEDLATPEAFARDPDLVWSWYAWRRSVVRDAQPNAAHHALVRLARHAPAFTLITQNVDGLHRRAGSADVIELHGDITRTRCSREGTVVHEYDAAAETPPRCPRCGAYLRPDVVWFGESLPPGALAAATEAAERCDVLLSIGTSGLVFPAASLVPLALGAGADVIVINPEPQGQAEGARVHQLAAPATRALPALVEAAWG